MVIFCISIDIHEIIKDNKYLSFIKKTEILIVPVLRVTKQPHVNNSFPNKETTTWLLLLPQQGKKPKHLLHTAPTFLFSTENCERLHSMHLEAEESGTHTGESSLMFWVTPPEPIKHFTLISHSPLLIKC